MMLGTNNLDLNTNDEIIRGIRETVELIADKQPQAQLYVVKILPRRGKEERLRLLNTQLEKALAEMPQVQVLDLSDIFIRKNGLIDEKLFSDGLHPNRKGYQAIARQLKRYVK